MGWKVKIVTDVGVLILPLNGSYRTRKAAEEDAEKAKNVPGIILSEAFKEVRK